MNERLEVKWQKSFGPIKIWGNVEHHSLPRLLGSPGILDGEAISGWIYRVCMHHKIGPNSLMSRWGFRGPTSALDVNDINQADLIRVARTTLQNPDDIDEASFLSHTILGRPKFVCLTNDIFSYRPIYRYCPTCLRGDVTPHIRISWRFAYSFVCEIHRCPLFDTCAHCARRIDLTWRFPSLRLVTGKSDEISCGHCSTCLHDVLSDPLCDEIANQMIVFQRWFHEKVRLGGRSERGILELAPMFVARYLRSVPSERSSTLSFVGLDMNRLFGHDWQDLAKQIPCMHSSGSTVPEESA